MAEPVFCNYRLYKTLPKLSGNMQLDLILGVGTSGSAYVRQAHIRPIAGTSYVPIVDERIMDRPHQNNIKKFYEQTKGNFYKSTPPPQLDSDWFMAISPHEMNNLKYIKTWDDSFLAGCQRMSYKLYGTTHEVLVPVWLDKCNGLKFLINFITTNNEGKMSSVVTRELNISEEYLYGSVAGKPFPYNTNEIFHNEFTKYLMDYFKYVKIMDGNSSVMNVQFKSGISTISGLMVESGNLATRLNYNIANNLTHRERPLLEANSLLTNTFADYKMICSQLLNFNLCFDFENMMGASSTSALLNGGNISVQVDVQVIRPRKDVNTDFVTTKNRSNLYNFYSRLSDTDPDTAYSWVGPLEVRDFYTNHDYVPRPQLKYNYGAGSTVQYYDDGPEYWWNALDYKKDNHSSEMMHKNKIAQSICHWVYAQQPDGNLFNVYDGFGAYVKDGNDTIIYDHGFGTTTDTTVDKFDPSADNTIWAGPPRIGDGDDVENTLNAPKEWIDNGYFKDASNFIGGFKFEFSGISGPNYTAPKKMWLGTMTTPWESNAEYRKTAATSYMTSRHIIGILVERLGADGMNDLPRTRQEQSSKFDNYYDWHYHSDIDNRFAIKKVVKGQTYYLYYNPSKIKISDELKKLINSDKDSDHKLAWEMANQQGIVWWETSQQAETPDDAQTRVRVGGYGAYNTSMRQHMNSTALYVAMRRKNRGGGTHRPDDDLCVVLWHPRSKKSTKEVSTTNRLLFGNLYPHGLTIGGFTSAIKDYCNKYNPCLIAIGLAKGDPEAEHIDFPDNLPNMDDMNAVLGAATSVVQPEIIWFDRSIEPTIDYTLSRNADEVKYYKKVGTNNYVLRYSGNIKPAMFPEKVLRRSHNGEKDHLSYIPTFGRNFAYQKLKIFPSLDMTPSQRLYIGVGIPPKYPSLGFDSIAPIIRTPAVDGDGKYISNECKVSNHGDILYKEPLPAFYGLTNNGINIQLAEPYKKYFIGDDKFDTNLQDFAYQTYEWYEYKWYDHSRIMMLPKKLKYIIRVTANDEASLELAAHAAMAWPASRMEMQFGVNREESAGSNRFFEPDSNIPIRNRYVISGDEKIPPISLKGKKYVLDSPFLRDTYDLEFNLQSTTALTTNAGEYARDPRTKQVLYEYIYEVIATLK